MHCSHVTLLCANVLQGSGAIRGNISQVPSGGHPAAEAQLTGAWPVGYKSSPGPTDGAPDVLAAACILMQSRNTGPESPADNNSTMQEAAGSLGQQHSHQPAEQGNLGGTTGFELSTPVEKLALWLCLLCAVGSLTHATLAAAGAAAAKKPLAHQDTS